MEKILFTLLIAFGVMLSSFAQDDYLSAELRTQVDALKQEAATTPTNQENVRTRTRVLWGWMNALAMTGQRIPVNATQVVSSVLAVPEGDRVTPRFIKAVGDLIVEFSARDDNPDALGQVSISSQGPFLVESWQTFEVTYVVGDLAIQEGGTILLGRSHQIDAPLWQHIDPARDSYISIRASDPAVTFETTAVPIRGMHGGFRGAAPQPAFKLTSGSLEKGETFTLTIGDTSGGSKGYQIQSYSNDAAHIPLYVDFRGEDVFFTLPLVDYTVVGAGVHAIHGFVPSVVGTGEAFDVSVRAEDRFFNRATGPIPELDVMLNGDKVATLPAGDDAIQIMAGQAVDAPGVYRYTFRSTDGSIEGWSDPIWVKDDPGDRIYWGETHGHCGFAEGMGSAEGYFIFGRDDARLDFLTLSEHDIWMDDYEWQVLNDFSEKFTEEGKFIAFPGYEWTARRQRGGHHNVFFRRPGMERVPTQAASNLTELFLGLHATHDPKDVLTIPHAHQAGDWRNSDVHLEHLVEIMSAHGTFEWFGDRYLQFGHQVGFVAASDDHIGHPGYTSGAYRGFYQRGGLAAVMSPDLTVDGIFDGMRNRYAYATSGPRIILDARLNGEGIGTRQEFTESRVLEGRVMGTAPISTVSLIKNGGVILENDYLKAKGTSAFLQVNFDSESKTFGRDNPRGYRPWNGYLTVSGATLKGFSTPGFQNRRRDWARVDASNPNVLLFNTATRGRINNLVLELDGVSEETKIRVVLKEGKEFGMAPIQVRPYAEIPSADLTFPVSDFYNAELGHEFQVGRHRDQLTLKFINPDSPMDQAFRFEDTTHPAPGDYYYVRVRQADGAQVWSSPFWVGGEPPR